MHIFLTIYKLDRKLNFHCVPSSFLECIVHLLFIYVFLNYFVFISLISQKYFFLNIIIEVGVSKNSRPRKRLGGHGYGSKFKSRSKF